MFEVLVVVTVKVTVIWNVACCSVLDIYQCYGESCCPIFRLEGESFRFLQDVGKQQLT
jgi:hypothetical protein